MGVSSTAYQFVLLLHIIAVVVGFGPLFMNPVFGAETRKRKGPEGIAVAEANFNVNKVAEKFVYAVPFLGIALVAMSDGAWQFTQLWVWLSLILYVAALSLSHTVQQPNVRRLLVVARELGPGSAGTSQAEEAERLGKQIAAVGGVLHLISVGIIALMIFKPGV